MAVILKVFILSSFNIMFHNQNIKLQVYDVGSLFGISCFEEQLLDKMTEKMLTFLYIELGYTVLFNIIFGVFFVRKVMKLDKLADNLDVTIPTKDWIKFAIIILLILLEILHIVFAYTVSSYWLNHHSNFSLSAFLYIANYTMQSYIVLKIITKGSGKRFKPNFLFWLFSITTSIVQIVVVNVNISLYQRMVSKDIVDTVIQIVTALLNFIVFIVSLIYDKVEPKRQILKQLRSDSDYSTGRTIQDSMYKWDRVPPSSRLFVQFNQQFQVQQDKHSLGCLFKLAVYVDQNAHILTKSDLDFIKFDMQLKKIFPNRHQVALPEPTKKFNNMMEYGEDRLKTYENFLLDLIGKGQFIVPCLLDFLEVPVNLRSKLLMNDFAHIVSKETGDGSEDEKNRKPFFTVHAQKGKIILENMDFVELIVNRSLVDILHLCMRLKEEKRLTLDILPQNPKQQDLVGFFSFIVNKKSMWRTFASWLRLDIQLQNKVYNYFDPWFLGFKNINIDIIGHQIVFDNQGKIHTVYLISMNGNITKTKNKASMEQPGPARGVIIKKRYSQFNTLDKQIRRFMKRKDMSFDHLPALPPKFSPFGSKTSPKSRQIRFAIYLKGLLQIEGINNCIKLLQFLEFDRINTIAQNKTAEAEQSDQSEISYFSELNQKH